MPSGFRPINDPRQGARTARGGSADSGGFRVIYDPSQDEAQRRQQQQQQQPAPKQEETGFWDQARRGALGAWGQVKTLPDQLGLGLDVRNVSRATSDLGTFQQIDKGTYKSSLFDSLMPGGGESVAKRWMSGQTDEAFRQSRAAAQYSAATPQQRTDLIKSRRGALETARTSAMENVAQIGEAQKRAAPYAPAVEDFTDIRSLGDFNKWLGYSIGSGAVSSAPALGIGLLTRSPAATVGVATGMEYGSGIQDRLNFIQNKVANLPPADQANAIIQYVDATKDETLRAALASGTLELFGPEAGAIKRALIKKAATEAGQEVAKTGFKEGLKAAGKEGLEEFATGGAQQVANLNLQFALDERQGSLLDRDSLKEIFNAAMAEGAGGFAIGGGMNIIQSRGVKGKGSDTNVDDQSLIKGKEDTDLGSDVAGGTEADDTITSGTKAAEPVREPQILPTEVVKGLFNEGNVIASLSNTGIAPKYLPTLAKRLTSAFQSNNEKELDNILKAQERRVDPAHSSIKSDEDLARNEAVYGAVSQLIGNFREFHNQALQEEELLTGPSEVTKYVGEKLKQEVARAKEAQLRTQQADEILNAQSQEAELQEQQRIASEAAAREQEIAAAAKRVENIHRQGILQTVVNDPETRDPVKRFTSLLKRNNFDATVSPEEAKALEAATAKLEQRTAGEAAKAGLSVEEYKQNLPAKSLREAENLGMTPEQYMTAKGAADEMGISVPAFVQMQQEQQLARQAVQAQPPAKPPVPFFELQAEREMGPADIAAMEKAQAKRERKAQRDAAKMAEQAVEDREQLSFLTEAAPAPEVVEGKKVVTPAKTGIKQKFDVGKKRAEAFDIAERERRAKALEEARAKAAKAKKSKRPALPKDKVAETKPEQKAKRPALPKDKVVEQKAEPKPVLKEKKSAAQKRKKPESGVSQRVRASEERKAPEAGRGNRPEQGREKPKAAEEKVKAPEVTYEDVLKEAETYLADDGESGLLKPKEYQQLSLLAEQGKVSPQDLMDRMEAIVTQRSEKVVVEGISRKTAPMRDLSGATVRFGNVEEQQKARRELGDELEKIGLRGKVAAVISNAIYDVKGFKGEYSPGERLIRIAMLGSAKDRAEVLHHEVIHFLRNAGFFTPQEWASLERMASRDDILRIGIRRTYRDSTATERAEERVAVIFQKWMRERVDPDYVKGSKAKESVFDPRGPFGRFMAMLDKIMDWFLRRNLPDAESIFKAIAEGKIAERGQVSPEVSYGQKMSKTLASKNMPDKVGSFAKNIGKRFLSATDESLSVYGFTENLIEDAQKLIPSTKKYLTSMRDRMMKKEEMTRHIDGIRSKFVGLGLQRQGVGSGTINGFLQNTVNTEKWGFQPDWLDAEVEVEVDPDLEAEFKRLPAKEQEIVKEALKTSYDTLKTKIDTVIEAVNSNYETLILKAMDENNEKKVAKLELEQKNALAEYRGLFAARKDKPYITTRRFGDYMVVAKSADMHTAVELGDKKLVEEMKGQEDHYFVQRYDTLQEARDARQKLIESGAFKDGTVVAGEVDKTYQQFVGSRDMMLAYDRLRKLIQNQVEALDETNKVNAKVIANMERMAVDLQLLALKQTSARKSELRKLGVAAGEMDMMRNFVAQGAADAHMISSLMYSKKIDEAIEGMRKEAFSDFSADPEKARRFYNELMLRHAAGMAYEHSNMAETIKTVTSMMMLSLSPSYYLTNMTQPWVLSVPYMAGEHSYAKVNAEMLKSYGEVAKAWGDLNVTDPLDLSKVSSDVRTAIEELANRGRIDIGVDKEIGAFHSLDAGTVSNAFDKSGAVIRALSQKIESINRVSTAAAAYRLAVAKGKSHEQAVDYADKVIRMTHGTYDGFNAPRWMRGPVASTITQFKKFQLMQVTLLWKLLKNSISKADTREAKLERAVARRQFAFTMWHTMALAGLRGMPGMTAVIFLWNLIVGAMDDDDEPEDIEQEIRDAIGKDYAELILTGAPSLAGIDISDRVGMGQAFSIMPYTDIKFSREGFFSALAGLLGPGAALVGKAGDAANALYKYGDYYGALGKLLPNGIDDAYAAVREATGGVKRGGDTVIDPEDIDFAQTFARAMGVMTTERAERLRKQDRNYSVREALKNRSGQITRAYVEARDSGDAEARKAAEEDWKALQVERERLGEKKQPLSNLLKAYRARETKRKSIVKGVEYSPKSEALRRAQEEAEAEDEE